MISGICVLKSITRIIICIKDTFSLRVSSILVAKATAAAAKYLDTFIFVYIDLGLIFGSLIHFSSSSIGH